MEWSTHAHGLGHRTIDLHGEVMKVRREAGCPVAQGCIPRPWPSGLYFTMDEGREQRFQALAVAAPPSPCELLVMSETEIEQFWDRAQPGWPTRSD